MRVIQVIPNFGLGGVQKAGCLIGKHLARRGHEAWVFGYEDGPRFVAETEAGGPSHRVVDRDRLVAELAELRPDVVHLHASNYEKAGLPPLLESASLADSVKVVTPVFGRPPEDRGLLKKVKTCCVGLYTFYRLLRWLSWSAERACEQGVIYAPLTPFEPPLSGVSATQTGNVIRERRAAAGIPPDAFVIGRIGRNAPAKWSPQVPAVVDQLLSSFPDTAWLSIGMPTERGAERLGEKWGSRFVNLPETPDYEQLCDVMSCLDAQLFMSRFGECFASSICDPAGLGVPTLAVSTPLNDNGQAEQVIDGVTGFLLGSGADAHRHINRLRSNPAELAELKRSTQRYALDNWHAEIVAERLEGAYSHWLANANGPGPLIESTVAAHREFAAGYRRRVVGLAAGNPFDYLGRYASLAACECHPIYRLGRHARRLFAGR